MAIVETTDAKFATDIEGSKQGLVLVDFWAPWCGPCRMLSPILEEVDKAGKNVAIFKVNVDRNVETAARYGVMSIPALMLFKGGKIVAKLTGLQSKQQLLDWIEKHTS